MKICFLCGKRTNKLTEGYCEECYNKEFKLIKLPKELKITICSKCGCLKEKNTWKNLELEDLVKQKIRILGEKVNVKLEVNDIVKIYAKGFLNNSKKIKEEYYEIPLNENKIICPTCSRRYGNYHEGIIQLRGDVISEILDFIDDQMTSEVLKDKRVFYKIKRVKGGYDLYMSDKHITNKISDLLKKKFKVKIKKSYKLVTRKKGKNIYKSTILVRI